MAQEGGEEYVCRASRYFFGVMLGWDHVNFGLAKLWCVALMVAIVVEEATEGGLVVAESEERAFGRPKTGEAMEKCVSFGDAAVEAEVPLLLFFELDLLRAFGKEMDSEEPREECVSLGGRLEEALVFTAGCRGAYVMSSLVLILLIVGSWFMATAAI